MKSAIHYRPQATHVLGVDVGGTKLATVLATRNGEILHKVRRPTEADRGPDFGVARLISMLRQNLAETEIAHEDIIGIGVACGSPMDAEQGIILGPPNLQSWNPVPIKEILEAEFGLYTQLENDANAGALAEWLFGAGRGKRPRRGSTSHSGACTKQIGKASTCPFVATWTNTRRTS